MLSSSFLPGSISTLNAHCPNFHDFVRYQLVSVSYCFYSPHFWNIKTNWCIAVKVLIALFSSLYTATTATATKMLHKLDRDCFLLPPPHISAREAFLGNTCVQNPDSGAAPGALRSCDPRNKIPYLEIGNFGHGLRAIAHSGSWIHC